MGRDVPRSLLRSNAAGPIVVAVAGAWALVAAGIAADGAAPVVTLGLFVPVLMIVAASLLLSRRMRRAAVAVVIGAIVVQTLGAPVLVRADGGWVPLFMMIGAMTAGIALVASAPMLLACAWLGPRDDLDGGDTLLGIGGAWAIVVTLVLWKLTDLDAAIAISTLAVGAILVAVAGGRAVARRVWLARVAGGRSPDYRLRAPLTPDERRALPPLFGGRRSAAAAIERITRDGAAPPYRTQTLGIAVAIAPAPPGRTAS